MASELSETVSHIVILSKERLSPHQIVARLKVSVGVVHGALWTGSVLSEVWPESQTRDGKRISSQIVNLLHKENKTLKDLQTVHHKCIVMFFCSWLMCVHP